MRRYYREDEGSSSETRSGQTDAEDLRSFEIAYDRLVDLKLHDKGTHG